MIKEKLILLLLGCAMLFSCKNSKSVPIIDLNRLDQSISLDITDILKDISIVQISSDFLFSVHDQIYITPQYLIIHSAKYSDRESLDLFSRKGEHIRKLAARGNGPGEFYVIEDFFVDEDDILYYKDMWYRNCLFRIDLSCGAMLDPLQIDFTYLTTNYMNGMIYSFPYYRGWFDQTNEYPDSAIVVSRVLLSSGEVKKFKGEHKYQFLFLGSSITSYHDEIVLINPGYSDTLFTLKDDKLSPLCVLHLSNKMTDTDKEGSVAQIISSYNNGVVLAKIDIVPSPPYGITYYWKYFVLYDRKGSVYKIDNIHVMNTKISIAEPEKYSIHSSLPIICGKYGYMLVEHDVLETKYEGFDPNNDNPIIIIGEIK